MFSTDVSRLPIPVAGAGRTGTQREAGAQLPLGTGCWSGLLDGLRSCHLLPSGNVPPAVREVDGSARVRPLDRHDYQAQHEALEQSLQAVVGNPDFRVTKTFRRHACKVHLNHPDAQDLPSNAPHVKRIAGHIVKCDAGLNGRTIAAFNPFAILRQHMGQAVLARLGLGPVSAIVLCDDPLPSERAHTTTQCGFRPVAISASHEVSGDEVDIDRDPPGARALMKSREAARAAGAAYAFGMTGLFKLERGRVRNLLRPVGSPSLVIIDGFDAGALEIRSAMLRERSIGRLFGMGRDALLQLLNECAEDTRAFAETNAGRLRHVDPYMDRSRNATAPLAELERYLEGCKRRIARLRD